MGDSILIVDDTPANLRLLEVLLGIRGYQIRTAPDAEEAMRMIEELPPRLILLDLRLPGMDGLELTRRLRSRPATRAILIIAVTAQAMRGDEEAAIAAGCDGFVTKPIDVRSFPDTIARFLAWPTS